MDSSEQFMAYFGLIASLIAIFSMPIIGYNCLKSYSLKWAKVGHFDPPLWAVKCWNLSWCVAGLAQITNVSEEWQRLHGMPKPSEAIQVLGILGNILFFVLLVLSIGALKASYRGKTKASEV